jgi:signal transduction histidine kinase
MGNELLSVSRLFFCAADVYMLYRFFSTMFKKKHANKINMIFSLSLIFLTFFVNSFGLSWLNLITLPLFYYIYVVLIFQISLTNGIAYTVIFYVLFAGGKEMSFEILYRLLTNLLPFYIPPWFTSGGLYFLLIEYFVGFLFLIYIEKFTRKIEISNNNNFSWYLLIVPIFSLIISINFLYLDFPESRFMQIFMCGGAFLLFFTNAAIFIILEKYTGVLNKVKYTELYTVKRDMENEHFQNILKINERYRCYMHDINAYFNSLRILASNGDNEKIIEIIDELKGDFHKDTSIVIYSGSPVLNAILTERVSKAKEAGIELSLFVEKFLKIDFVSDADMISMLGNLMDNALEAAAKCSPDNRRVDVKLFMGTNYFLIFHIENSFAELARKEGARLLSTKADPKHHGLGIGIVATLAEKYGGSLNLEEKGGLFVTTLTISACI